MRAVLLEPGQRSRENRCLGNLRQYPRPRHARVGHPDWSHRSYVTVVDDEALDLFLIAGRDPAQVLERYTTLTGRAPKVPLWSLGLWVSRAYYRTPDEAIAVAEQLRARKIPCDVLSLDGRAVWDVQT